jgi:hypothetical protein
MLLIIDIKGPYSKRYFLTEAKWIFFFCIFQNAEPFISNTSRFPYLLRLAVVVLVLRTQVGCVCGELMKYLRKKQENDG